VSAADTPQLVPLLRMGSVGAIYGDLATADVTGDGIADIVGCSGRGFPFALSKHPGANEYDVAWIGPAMGCTNVAAGDLDGDGIAEIAVVKKGSYYYSTPSTGRLAIFSALTTGRALAQTTFNSQSDYVVDVAIANVDADPAVEIIVTSYLATYVYDKTLALEWTAVDRGGFEVATGDLEGDGQVEIVVNGSPAHVLSAYTQTEKWAYLGGFGGKMSIGDADNDGKAEIAYRYNSSISLFDADTFTNKWTITAYYSNNVLIADANGDGQREVLAGDSYERLRGYRGSDGVEVWNFPGYTSSMYGLIAGDFDGDGAPEIAWSGGTYNAHIYTGSVQSGAIEWTSLAESSYVSGAVADLDGDGTLELIVASSYDYAGRLQIFDYATRTLEATLPQPTNFPEMRALRIGQLDADPALEIAVLGDYYDGRLFVWDGVTHELQWQSPSSNYNDPTFTPDSFVVANIDGDPVDEIILGTSDKRIEVLNGATPIVQFLSNTLLNPPIDLKLGDVNADGTRDLVVTTYAAVYVFETAGWTERTHFTLSSAQYVAVAPEASMFFVSAGGSVHAYSGVDFSEQWSCAQSPNAFAQLSWATIAGKGRLAAFNLAAPESFVFMPAADGCTNREPVAFDEDASTVTSTYFADVDGDGRKELFVNRAATFEIYAVDFASEPRGDANGDAIVSDADIDALAQHFYGDLRGVSSASDVDGDDAITQRDLFYLVNYRRAGGPAPLP